MKRFDVVPEYGTVTDLYQIESPDGEYVDADIAQELYDALKETRHVVQGLVYEGYSGYVELRTKIDDVLEKADKD